MLSMQSISSLLNSGEQLMLRTADLVASSRITWLATGILTTGFLGRVRADRLQDLRKEPHEHTPADCRTAHCKDLERPHVKERGLCYALDCEAEHFQVKMGKHLWTYHRVVHPLSWKAESRLSWSRWLVGKDTLCAGAYGLALLFVATGGGRVPATRDVLRYVTVQTGVKILDAVVMARFVMGETKYWKLEGLFEGRTKGFEYGSVWGWKRRSTSELVVAGAYFGIRLVDGWFMASMPANTVPMMSLFAKLKPLLNSVLPAG